MIDREQVAEALANGENITNDDAGIIMAAAQAWVDQGDALVIRRDELRNALWQLVMEAYRFEDDDPDDIADAENIIHEIIEALSDRSDNGEPSFVEGPKSGWLT